MSAVKASFCRRLLATVVLLASQGTLVSGCFYAKAANEACRTEDVITDAGTCEAANDVLGALMQVGGEMPWEYVGEVSVEKPFGCFASHRSWWRSATDSSSRTLVPGQQIYFNMNTEADIKRRFGGECCGAVCCDHTSLGNYTTTTTTTVTGATETVTLTTTTQTSTSSPILEEEINSTSLPSPILEEDTNSTNFTIPVSITTSTTTTTTTSATVAIVLTSPGTTSPAVIPTPAPAPVPTPATSTRQHSTTTTASAANTSTTTMTATTSAADSTTAVTQAPTNGFMRQRMETQAPTNVFMSTSSEIPTLEPEVSIPQGALADLTSTSSTGTPDIPTSTESSQTVPRSELPPSLGDTVDFAVTAAAEQEVLSRLERLTEGNESRVTMSVPGAVVTAQRLLVAEVTDAGGRIAVPVAGTTAVASVPAKLIQQLGGDIIILLTAYNSSNSNGNSSVLDSQGVEAMGLVSVKMSSTASPGEVIHVHDLDDPIQVTLTTNGGIGTQCVYWDIATSRWSSAGLKTARGSLDSPLVCSSTHLTLFAAVWKGLSGSFVCSQAVLFSGAGLVELKRGDWLGRQDTLLLLSLLFVTWSMLFGACFLDRRRAQQGLRTDELFLLLGDASVDLTDVQDVEKNVQNEPESNIPSRSMGICCAACLVGCFSAFCHASRRTFQSVLKPVCEQTVGNVNDLSSILVDLYGGVTDQANAEIKGEHRSVLRRLLDRMLTRAFVTSIQLQTSASLLMSVDDVQLFLDKVREEAEEAEQAPGTPSCWVDTSVTPTKVHGGKSTTTVATAACMSNLKESVRSTATKHMVETGPWRNFPQTFRRIFTCKNPWIAVMQYSLYTPASISMLLLMCEAFGEMAIAALFYRASGAKAKGGPQQCSDGEVWDAVGSMLAVGIAASVSAMLPELVLSAIRSRDFKEFVNEDSAEWQLQLKIWYYQDLMVWFIGLPYILFCLFFVSLFLANVSTKDGLMWVISSVFAILQSAVVIPFAVALALSIGSLIAARNERIRMTVYEDPAFKSATSGEFDKSANFAVVADFGAFSVVPIPSMKSSEGSIVADDCEMCVVAIGTEGSEISILVPFSPVKSKPSDRQTTPSTIGTLGIDSLWTSESECTVEMPTWLDIEAMQERAPSRAPSIISLTSVSDADTEAPFSSLFQHTY